MEQTDATNVLSLILLIFGHSQSLAVFLVPGFCPSDIIATFSEMAEFFETGALDVESFACLLLASSGTSTESTLQ